MTAERPQLHDLDLANVVTWVSSHIPEAVLLEFGAIEVACKFHCLKDLRQCKMLLSVEGRQGLESIDEKVVSPAH